jgi:hypothetical protein
MKKQILISGFCPTQNCEYRIDVNYVSYGNQGMFLKTGTKCDYACENYDVLCPIYKQCPIQASAPENISV